MNEGMKRPPGSFLSIREAADILNLKYKAVYRLVRSGQLPAAKIGGVYRIKYDDLLTYFDSQKAILREQCRQSGVDPGTVVQGQGQ